MVRKKIKCSSPKIDHYKNILDNLSIKIVGVQHVTTLDKHKIPMSIRGAFPYMTLLTYTDKEWSTLYHAILTSDID